MTYYDSINNIDTYKTYVTSSDWKYISAVNQEPIELIRVTNERVTNEEYKWEPKYKWDSKYKAGRYAIDTRVFEDYPDQSYESYNKIKNNRLNKPDKEKNELLSWIDNK